MPISAASTVCRRGSRGRDGVADDLPRRRPRSARSRRRSTAPSCSDSRSRRTASGPIVGPGKCRPSTASRPFGAGWSDRLARQACFLRVQRATASAPRAARRRWRCLSPADCRAAPAKAISITITARERMAQNCVDRLLHFELLLVVRLTRKKVSIRRRFLVTPFPAIRQRWPDPATATGARRPRRLFRPYSDGKVRSASWIRPSQAA